MNVILQGPCKPNWDIRIWVFFPGILGYYLFQIGILGYSQPNLGYWDTALMSVSGQILLVKATVDLTNLWECMEVIPLRCHLRLQYYTVIQVSLTISGILGFGPYEIGILGYGSPEIGIFGIPGPPPYAALALRYLCATHKFWPLPYEKSLVRPYPWTQYVLAFFSFSTDDLKVDQPVWLNPYKITGHIFPTSSTHPIGDCHPMPLYSSSSTSYGLPMCPTVPCWWNWLMSILTGDNIMIKKPVHFLLNHV